MCRFTPTLVVPCIVLVLKISPSGNKNSFFIEQQINLLINNIQMEGGCQLTSKAGNEQVRLGKIQIKGVTMATLHRSPPLETCHTGFSEENKCTYLDRGPTTSQDAGGREQAKDKNDKARQSKTMLAQHSNGTAMAQLRIPTA